MFKFTQDVNEHAARETAEQQPVVVTISDRERGGHVPPSLTVARTRAANQPAITVAAPLERSTNLICTHRDTANASKCATVAAK